MTGLRRLTGLIICSGLMWAAPAAADPISELNVIASDTIFAGGRPAGAAPMLDFAMVHAAIHDAVQAYEKRFRPYEFHIWWRPRGSRVAAAAAAARDVLVNRFPAQEAVIQTKYLLFLTNHGLTPADEGTDVGERAASAIIARRANDGSYPTPPPPPDLGGTGAGQWRPTLPLFAPFSAPWLGKVEPFTKDFSAQFRARRPPALTSREYARDYNEVKAKGGAVGHTRTPDQTQIAHFYAGNTIALFQGMIRGLIGACEMGSRQRYCKSLDRLGDSARLFALANLAGADAGITAWHSKKRHNFWRPITAIQQVLPADDDENPRTEADAAWMPLRATPPYPDYTSGANNLSGAFTTIAARFFDTDGATFTVTTTDALAVPNERTYHRFSDLADDVVDARIYMGIHFRFADTAARREGTRIATQAFNHFLRPVRDHGHDHDKDCRDHDDDDDWDDRHGRGRDRESKFESEPAVAPGVGRLRNSARLAQRGHLIRAERVFLYTVSCPAGHHPIIDETPAHRLAGSSLPIQRPGQYRSHPAASTM